MELASDRPAISASEAARQCSVFAAHGIFTDSLPRRTVEIQSLLAFNATFRLEAVAQARSRCVCRGGRSWHFTPEETRCFRKILSTEARRQWGTRELLGCCRFECDVFMPRPEKLCGPNVTELAFPCVTAPDVDNSMKSALDSLQGIAFKNDAHVSVGSLSKWYVPMGEKPWIEIRLYELVFSKAKKGTYLLDSSERNRSSVNVIRRVGT